MVISSKENETIKEIRKLKEKKYRTEKYIIEGIKMIEEAIRTSKWERHKKKWISKF